MSRSDISVIEMSLRRMAGAGDAAAAGVEALAAPGLADSAMVLEETPLERPIPYPAFILYRSGTLSISFQRGEDTQSCCVSRALALLLPFLCSLWLSGWCV